MQKELKLVEEFHKKFRALIGNEPQNIPKDRIKLRFELMKEEVDEYFQGASKKDIENVAKELADILYAVYGTIIEHGLQYRFEEIFTEVHRSHMSKDYSQYKMIKGKSYFEPDLKKFFKK
ncbi:MAG: hypothetical protein GWO87_01680 [Xanthomonadaceae bacterium]|nr:hypothetical protein [Rhodospirillaceae bacterium]NIA17881.1 hypothetical protein [Xanthomonadaceae bacterium]